MNNTPQSFQKAFTLVELAIVMTIIGLLIGGILKGQELLENARVTSTIAQVKSYDAAVTGFRDIYDGVPGDLLNAQNRLPGCNEYCNPPDGYGGDGKVGQIWGYETAGDGSLALPSTDPYAETNLFWIHLLKANLIAGVSDAAIQQATPWAWGVTHPAAKIGGGFSATEHNNGLGTDSLLGAPAGAKLAFIGLAIVLGTAPVPAINDMMTPGMNVLTPGRAAQIDRKMDDGVPDAGTVQAWGVTDSCFSVSGDGFAYAENLSSKDCSVSIKIQG